MERPTEIRLNEEMFIGLLQGKKLEYVEHMGGGETRVWRLYPPHHGLYFTHAQIAQMKEMAYRQGASDLVDFIEKARGSEDTPPRN